MGAQFGDSGARSGAVGGQVEGAERADFTMAGEPERRTREQRNQDGIPLDEKTWQQLAASFTEWGVAVD